jgi:hypothetical protein
MAIAGAVVLGQLAIHACSSFGATSADPVSDASSGDAASVDAGAYGYHDPGNPAFWETFDLKTLDANAGGYAGAVFDGRYLYLVPHETVAPHGVVARYDTQAPLDSHAAWTLFDVARIDTNARGFMGAVFDGGVVYFVPYFNGSMDGVVARYDIAGDFSARGSWSTFDTTGVDPSARGFWGGGTDGNRYIYLSPIGADGRHVVARYDSWAPNGFGMRAQWATFDTTTVSARAVDFAGAVFDGRYMYFVPGGDNGVVARHDPVATLAQGWSVFDTTTVDGRAGGWTGAVFDGRFIYLAPYSKSQSTAVAARFDTQAPFDSPSSWSTFDPTALNADARGFRGAVFDGRYVYFVPNDNTKAIVTRHDTTAPFGKAEAWATFDLTAVDQNAHSFFGGAFDGRYVYMVPSGGRSVIARFYAKEPRDLPRTRSASFL